MLTSEIAWSHVGRPGPARRGSGRAAPPRVKLDRRPGLTAPSVLCRARGAGSRYGQRRPRRQPPDRQQRARATGSRHPRLEPGTDRTGAGGPRRWRALGGREAGGSERGAGAQPRADSAARFPGAAAHAAVGAAGHQAVQAGRAATGHHLHRAPHSQPAGRRRRTGGPRTGRPARGWLPTPCQGRRAGRTAEPRPGARHLDRGVCPCLGRYRPALTPPSG